MGVNGKKLNFQANGGRWRAMGWKQHGIASSPYIIMQQHPVIEFVNKRGGGVKGLPNAHRQAHMGVNGQKLNFQANGGRWRDNKVETAWNHFISVYNIATAS